MGREDPFIVRNSLAAVSESTSYQASLNRAGTLIVTDFLTQLILGGYAYHIQAGTEDAPVAATAAIDDQLAFMLVDQNVGYAMLPLGLQTVIANWSTSTLFNTMLEADKDLKRYSSGGTAFTPANLRGDDPYSFNGAAYVAAADVVPIAKSAVPNSVELWRGGVIEDAQATPDGAAAAVGGTATYSIRTNPFIVLVDASSFVIHHGATTADPNSYGNFQFAQFVKGLII
jgi:hypothetical protein